MPLSSLLARIEAGFKPDATAPEADEFPTISHTEKACGKTQVIDTEDFSHTSHISHPPEGGYSENEKEAAQARAGGRGGAHARPSSGEVGSVGNACRDKGLSFPHSHSQVGNVGNREGAAPSPASAPPGLSPDEAAAFDERAGFLEYDCGLSRADAERQALAEFRFGAAAPTPPTATRLPDRDGLDLWQAGLARLTGYSVPCDGYREGEWPRVYARARSFLDNYGEQAEALGWTAPRLFGVHPQAGIVRVDTCGGLVLPIGGPVLAITATEIRFAHLTHRQKPGQPEGVPLWSLAR